MIGSLTEAKGLNAHCKTPQFLVLLVIFFREHPVPIEITLKSFILNLGLKYFKARSTEAIEGELVTMPPSIKFSWEGKYVGAAQAARAISIIDLL